MHFIFALAILFLSICCQATVANGVCRAGECPHESDDKASLLQSGSRVVMQSSIHEANAEEGELLDSDLAEEVDEDANGKEYSEGLQARLQVGSEDEQQDAASSADATWVQERTTVEVDMATTKIIAGVPVFNYHLANEGGMNPSLLELTQPKDFIINFGASFTDGDEKTFCANPPGNSKCEPSGHPSEGGIPFAVFTGTEEELKQILTNHADLKPSFVEPDQPVSLVPEMPNTASLLEMDEQGSVPWGLDRIDDKKGLDGSYSVPGSKYGAGVHVYVADSGIHVAHTDFEGRAVPGIEVLSGPVKECSTTDKQCAADRQGHGTHCAATVGGKLYGVAKKASLYAVKILGDDGSGAFSSIIKSVDWIASKGKKPAIWSASLGAKVVMHSVEKTFASALSKGVMISVAAGNDNDDACETSPAFAPSAITVGALTSSDGLAGFSNHNEYGNAKSKCVNILGPGVNVKSASHRSTTGSETMSGTSMACPHVSGGLALFLGDNPGLTPDGARKILENKALIKDIPLSKFQPWLTTRYSLLYVGSGLGGPVPTPAPTLAPPTPPPTPAPPTPPPAPTPPPTGYPARVPANVVVGQPYVCGYYDGVTFDKRFCYCNGDVYYGKMHRKGKAGSTSFDDMTKGGCQAYRKDKYQSSGCKIKTYDQLKDSNRNKGFKWTLCGGCINFWDRGFWSGYKKQCYCVPKYANPATPAPTPAPPPATFAPLPPGAPPQDPIWPGPPNSDPGAPPGAPPMWPPM